MVGGRQRHALSYLQDFLFAPKRAHQLKPYLAEKKTDCCSLVSY